ncbi:MAG TPA: class I SAM-dependent rRNA methyltransferase [Burkholderiaceae bacterium]|nr:class I SAM-dependent rRNA methyltransferase [Burkholderiaceae bacterium]
MSETASILQLKPGKEKSLLRRHPWVYATAVARVRGRVQSGSTVRVESADGRFLAWAAFSPESAIRARAWTYDEARPVTPALVSERLAQAIARRAPLAARTDAVRLVFGEADGLPGLVVDRYGRQLVVQFLAAGVDAWREHIVRELPRLAGCDDVYERSDAQAREREGLVPREGVIAGAPPPGRIEIVEDEVRYGVDVVGGHKTGFYIDQRDNRRLVARQAAGRRMLNCFCYTGGFTVAALRGGAAAALSVDSSEPALGQARANEAANGLPPSDWRAGNVFEVLKALLEEGRRFDLIVLDPPKFAPSAQHLERAARAYKEINLKALKLLDPGGLLFTFSCSGAMSVDLFQKVVAGAVIDARVDAQLVRRLAAGADHPMLMTHPEGEYLKGLMLVRV